jgi:hypothetical protein
MPTITFPSIRDHVDEGRASQVWPFWNCSAFHPKSLMFSGFIYVGLRSFEVAWSTSHATGKLINRSSNLGCGSADTPFPTGGSVQKLRQSQIVGVVCSPSGTAVPSRSLQVRPFVFRYSHSSYLARPFPGATSITIPLSKPYGQPSWSSIVVKSWSRIVRARIKPLLLCGLHPPYPSLLLPNSFFPPFFFPLFSFPPSLPTSWFLLLVPPPGPSSFFLLFLSPLVPPLPFLPLFPNPSSVPIPLEPPL